MENRKMNSQIFEILRDKKSYFQEKYNISEIGIFGSYARGEERTESDVDILVEYYKTPDFFKFLDLEDELEKLFNKPIDLVSKPALKPLIRDQILKETIYI